MNICFILGKLCSGKSSYCKQYMQDFYHISVSNIVKKITALENRSDLQQTSYLDSIISNSIINDIEIALQTNKQVVIDGCRQLSIIKKIIDFFGSENVYYIWLDVDDNILKMRYDNLRKTNIKKYNISFENAIINDSTLGLDDVYNFILNKNTTIKTFNKEKGYFE
jgi:predicted kinase